MGERARKLLYLSTIMFILGPVILVDALALPPHERDGWMIGVAWGVGEAELTLVPAEEGEDVRQGWEQGVVPQMRIGHAIIKNRLFLSFENKQWLEEQGVLEEDKIRVNVQSWTFALTLYPSNPQSAYAGLYLQAGAGWANGRLTILEPLEDDPWGNEFEEIFVQDDAGSAFFFGIGYEFRVIRNSAVGAAVSYNYQSLKGEIFDEVVSIPFTLTWNWYW